MEVGQSSPGTFEPSTPVSGLSNLSFQLHHVRVVYMLLSVPTGRNCIHPYVPAVFHEESCEFVTICYQGGNMVSRE